MTNEEILDNDNYLNAALLRGPYREEMRSALLSTLQQARQQGAAEQRENLLKIIVQMAVPLEALRASESAEPFSYISSTINEAIIKATDLARGAIRTQGEEVEKK